MTYAMENKGKMLVIKTKYACRVGCVYLVSDKLRIAAFRVQ